MIKTFIAARPRRRARVRPRGAGERGVSAGPRASSRHLAREREEVVEDVLVVFGPGSGFGVELDRPDRQRSVRETLDGSIVEVPMAHEQAARRVDRLLVDLKLVVLRRDGDLTAPQIANGMVRAVMAEWQSRRRRSDRAGDQLMAEADAQDREPARRGGVEEQARRRHYRPDSGGHASARPKAGAGPAPTC